MQLRPVRRAVLVPAAPGLALRVLVEPVDPGPGGAAILRAKQTLRRRPGVPHARFACVTGSEPEAVVDGAPTSRMKGRRAHRLLPGSTAINRAKYRRPQMAGAHRCEKCLAIARVEDRVMHDVSEELGTREFPRSPRSIAFDGPQTLARRDQQLRGARRRRTPFSLRNHAILPSGEPITLPRPRGYGKRCSQDPSHVGVEIRRGACNPDGLFVARSGPPCRREEYA